MECSFLQQRQTPPPLRKPWGFYFTKSLFPLGLGVRVCWYGLESIFKLEQQVHHNRQPLSGQIRFK